MIVVESILAFIVLVGILVFIHELGHFLAARATGMRADVFAVGMGPRVMGYNKLTGFSFGKLPEDLDLQDHTDYRLSAFPIGGYVKIAGMVDESMDTSFAATPPKPWEFRSKSTLQKAFVISAGVIMNFLLAVVVMAGIYLFVGREVTGTTAIGPLPTDGPAYEAGLRPGDKVVAVNGAPVEYFEEVLKRVYVDAALDDAKLSVERNGMPMEITIPRTEIGTHPVEDRLLSPRIGVLIDRTEVGSPADQAGLQRGDTMLQMDGKPIGSGEEFRAYISSHINKPIALTLKRGSSTLVKEVKPGSNGRIGVVTDYYPKQNVKYGFFEALAAGFDESVNMTGNIFKGIGALVTGRANLKESVAGPVMIAQAAQQSATQGPIQFLRLMVIISIGLACMNILPIPALDGGHLVFILIEGIIRREVPIKIRMAVQNVGFVLILLLMAFVMYNDAAKLFGN